MSDQRLASFIERIERLETDKRDIQTDIKEVYAEAKGVGYDTKSIRRIIKLRKIEAQKRAEEGMLLETYASAIGLDNVFLEG